jgi:uncharacterized protein with NRDE domain
MCVLFLAWQVHRQYPLILAANRDEFHARTAHPAAPWPQAPQVVGGLDLAGGGSWLAVTAAGRFAVITNYREPGRHLRAAPSRGALVADYLTCEQDAIGYAKVIEPMLMRYNGFNLLLGDAGQLVYVSNRRDPACQTLGTGVYGLSNGLLDSPWPKVKQGRARFAGEVVQTRPDPARLLALLYDKEPAADAELPDTGIGRQWERVLSALFIQTPDYGTRSSTILMIRRDGAIHLLERSYDPAGRPSQDQDWRCQAGSWQPGAAELAS